MAMSPLLQNNELTQAIRKSGASIKLLLLCFKATQIELAHHALSSPEKSYKFTRADRQAQWRR